MITYYCYTYSYAQKQCFHSWKSDFHSFKGENHSFSSERVNSWKSSIGTTCVWVGVKVHSKKSGNQSLFTQWRVIDFRSFWSELSLFWSDFYSFLEWVSLVCSDFHSFSNEWSIISFFFFFFHSFTFREYPPFP